MGGPEQGSLMPLGWYRAHFKGWGSQRDTVTYRAESLSSLPTEGTWPPGAQRGQRGGEWMARGEAGSSDRVALTAGLSQGPLTFT